MFRDRTEAGRSLVGLLTRYARSDAVVLGLPRGGVVTAFEVAEGLGLPPDVAVVRKVGAPHQRELALGAVGEDGAVARNDDLISALGVDPDDLADREDAARGELEARLARLRTVRPREPLAGRVAILVDDGIATGATAAAACSIARQHGARRVVVAAPVASPEAVERLGEIADEVVVTSTPRGFRSVGEHYVKFGEVHDDRVLALLADSRMLTQEVSIPADGVRLPAELALPPEPRGLVIFAHGSGSSRHSPRNRTVARALNRAGLATVLLDLLEPEEARSRVFDAPLLARRLGGAVDWCTEHPALRALPLLLFGASTGSAAVLLTAAERPRQVAAVVSRGGRPDLAADALDRVHAPTLLIVGSADEDVLALNRAAQQWLHCETALAVVPGASHLFEEPGALDEVADLAAHWFLSHLDTGVHAAAADRR